jgi:hypothetical protein
MGKRLRRADSVSLQPPLRRYLYGCRRGPSPLRLWVVPGAGVEANAYELGAIPGARCNPGNIASRKTLQKAGFVPCAHILDGTIVAR